MKFYGCKIYGRKKSIYDKEHEMDQLKDTLRRKRSLLRLAI